MAYALSFTIDTQEHNWKNICCFFLNQCSLNKHKQGMMTFSLKETEGMSVAITSFSPFLCLN